MNVKSDMRDEIIPNNILMIGATGVGKTEIARRLAKIADAPFVKVEASKFTEVGYVGRDVESMVRDLVEQSVNMVKAKKKEEVKEKAAQIVEDIRSSDAILISVPPNEHGDPVLRSFAGQIAQAQNLRWLGYLSTVGVYGDHAGNWVDEKTPTMTMPMPAMPR